MPLELTAGVVTGDAECVLLGPLLRQSLQLWVARGMDPPAALVAHSDAVSRAERRAVNAQFSVSPVAAGYRELPNGRGSGQPVRLTIREACQVARVGETTMRKWCRRRDVQALRGPRGAWLVDGVSLMARVRLNRVEREMKAA